MYCRVNLQFGQVHIITREHLNSGQRNIRVSVFDKYHRISLLSIFSQLPRQDFSTLILLSIYSIPLDRLIFDSRWDPSQGPSDRKFNGYQIGAFPEIRLTAPSPAPTSD
ncbi:hypothetical protein N7530_012443 [Penicillium desertorum]|uniref:Uncharacterized protein n=1 Tax=Penicillium desertorum TaxID=1303715 RepID=A0A9X0BGR1_9EURO|nr:hypothetical protein N7530_012443 [Penicillium desertorum]